jgi:hypothetical protein
MFISGSIPPSPESKGALSRRVSRALGDIDVVATAAFAKAAATPVRPVTQNTFDYHLVLEFEDVDRHNAYQVHPDHEVFVKNFSPWFREVRVFDAEF